jgi:hypothetical protein
VVSGIKAKQAGREDEERVQLQEAYGNIRHFSNNYSLLLTCNISKPTR